MANQQNTNRGREPREPRENKGSRDGNRSDKGEKVQDSEFKDKLVELNRVAKVTRAAVLSPSPPLWWSVMAKAV